MAFTVVVFRFQFLSGMRVSFCSWLIVWRTFLSTSKLLHFLFQCFYFIFPFCLRLPTKMRKNIGVDQCWNSIWLKLHACVCVLHIFELLAKIINLFCDDSLFGNCYPDDPDESLHHYYFPLKIITFISRKKLRNR